MIYNVDLWFFPLDLSSFLLSWLLCLLIRLQVFFNSPLIWSWYFRLSLITNTLHYLTLIASSFKSTVKWRNMMQLNLGNYNITSKFDYALDVNFVFRECLLFEMHFIFRCLKRILFLFAIIKIPARGGMWKNIFDTKIYFRKSKKYLTFLCYE